MIRGVLLIRLRVDQVTATRIRTLRLRQMEIAAITDGVAMQGDETGLDVPNDLRDFRRVSSYSLVCLGRAVSFSLW